MAATINAIIEELRKFIKPNENEEAINGMIDSLNSWTPINITMQQLSLNVIWGSILAIPTGLLVMKKAKP